MRPNKSMEKTFNQIKYISEYNKKHYIRKEVKFRKEEYELVENILNKNNLTLKKYIMDKIKQEK